jgi:hypothetical protein
MYQFELLIWKTKQKERKKQTKRKYYLSSAMCNTEFSEEVQYYPLLCASFHLQQELEITFLSFLQSFSRVISK